MLVCEVATLARMRVRTVERLTFDEGAQQTFNQRTPGDEAYAGTCPLGRTFGTLHLKGHTAVSDLLPGGHEAPGSDERARLIDAANATEQRNGVGIDRLMGSAKRGALFDQEVVVDGRFDGRIILRNVQLYQLVLVLLVLRDLNEGYVQLGSGTTRGNGWVAAEIRRLTIESRAGKTAAGRLAGFAELDDDLAPYDLFSGDTVDLPEGLTPRRELIWDRLDVLGEDVNHLAAALVDGPWTSFLEQTKGKTWKA